MNLLIEFRLVLADLAAERADGVIERSRFISSCVFSAR